MRRTFVGFSVIFTFVFLSAIAIAKEPAPDQYNDDPSACDQVAGNLVHNCGWETGDFSMWTRSGDPTATFVDTGSAHTGTYGLDAGPVTDLGFFSQMLNTGDQGAMHHISFWLANLGGTPNRFQVSWEGNIIYDQSNLDAFNYTRFDFDVFACGGMSELKFGFYQAPTYFHFDDVVVTRTTE